MTQGQKIATRDAYGDALAPYVEAGAVVRNFERLALTRSGMLVANEVLSVFV